MTSTDHTPDVAADADLMPDVAAGAAPAPPNPHATAEQVEAALKDTKLAQVLYHDWEAETYDDKWSISYDQRCIDYARGGRFDAIVPDEVQRELPYDRALELGCGTGFFLLNLIQAGGVARRGSVTDLSPGMVKVATRNGQGLGLDIDGKVADARASRTRTTPSTWWSATPCCTTSPMWSSRCARWSGCSSQAAGSSSPGGNRPARAMSTHATCPP